MARPASDKINYFSFDVDFFEDEKIEPISGEFGLKGEIIVIRLLCAVYRNGYFILWNEQLKMALANRCKVSAELIEQVICRLVKWGFLDEHLFNSEKIITSRGIQRRWKEATRKRKINYDSLDFWLLSDENRIKGGRNSFVGELKAEETPQSKVKESKEKNIIKKEGRIITSQYYELLCSDLSWIEIVCMNQRLSTDKVQNLLIDFFATIAQKEQDPSNEQDAKQHFINWLKYQKGETNEQESKPKQSINLHPALTQH